ncbi:MAG: hypothetical protein A2437_04210 [Bacteroidetes bacterium RIFOXYC2_FULL_40_12]|nr:MAG: hypothetical protein A2437_04210 [Bacteroidetes bacterium RIFOXYC2_FULL_40_12]
MNYLHVNEFVNCLNLFSMSRLHWTTFRNGNDRFKNSKKPLIGYSLVTILLKYFCLYDGFVLNMKFLEWYFNV